MLLTLAGFYLSVYTARFLGDLTRQCYSGGSEPFITVLCVLIVRGLGNINNLYLFPCSGLSRV